MELGEQGGLVLSENKCRLCRKDKELGIRGQKRDLKLICSSDVVVERKGVWLSLRAWCEA